MAVAINGSPTVFFSAGEASGDAYAAELLRALSARSSNVSASAIGGRRSREAGAEIVADSSDWGAVGILESLKVVPRVFRGYLAAKRRLSRSDRGVFVPIDFGYLNIRLARQAKAAGWKVLYFIPPGSWRRTKQGADLPSVTDEIVTPFPWSAEILNEMGASAHFFGHPLKAMIGDSQPVDLTRAGIAVLPGSRRHEIERNLEPIVEALRGEEGPFRVALASNVAEKTMADLWNRVVGLPAEFRRDTYAVLRESEVGVICSGTATLEAAVCGCPMVVIYRGSKLMEWEFRIRRPKFDAISLPNILLGRPLVPELIQHDASPDRIRQELALLRKESGRQAQIAGFTELRDLLGPSDCMERTADLLLPMATPS